MLRYAYRRAAWMLILLSLLLPVPVAGSRASTATPLPLTTAAFQHAARQIKPGGVALTHLGIKGSVDGTVTVSGTLDQADFQLTFPADWNHELVLYAHGYVAPDPSLGFGTGIIDGATAGLLRTIVSQGYAVAYSSYAKIGYAVQAGMDDTALLKHLIGLVVPVSRSFIVGSSMGGDVVMGLIESEPHDYAGALAYCGVVAGWSQEIRYLFDVRVIYDYFTRKYPDLALPGAGHALTPNADLTPLVILNSLSVLFTRAKTKPAYAAIIAQVAAVTGANPDIVSFAIALLTATVGLNDYLQTAGGNGYSNVATVYHGSKDDRTLNAGVERIAAVPAARAYTDRFYTPAGTFDAKLLTIHNLIDPLVPYGQERLLRALVASRHNLDNLVQQVVDPDPVNPAQPQEGGPAHCYFTTAQLVFGWNELQRWVVAGKRPPAAANITRPD